MTPASASDGFVPRKPLAHDIYCGLGGWTEGLQSEGYDVIGWDNERHVYGEARYPGLLVVQDALTIHGSQLKDAALIVASPPCTEFSYMAMPWKRAKAISAALRGEGEFPAGYTGSRTVKELTRLFDACFRIQGEASDAAGRHVPMVVENVCGAQPWVGRARWNYGSYYLWGDVPALMPHATHRRMKFPGSAAPRMWRDRTVIRLNGGEEHDFHQKLSEGAAFVTASSGSSARKAASAKIAKIPEVLSRHIGRTYFPTDRLVPYAAEQSQGRLKERTAA